MHESEDIDILTEQYVTPMARDVNTRSHCSVDQLSVVSYSWGCLLAAVWCVVLTISDLKEIWIYELSQWVLGGFCSYMGFLCWRQNLKRTMILFWIMVVIFNPIVPIRFGATADMVNALAGMTFLGAFVWFGKAGKNRIELGVCTLIGVLLGVSIYIFPWAYLDI